MLGGGTLWILGDIVGLPFLAAQLIQMIREDEAEAKVIDAELDARDAAQAGRASASQARGSGQADAGARPGRRPALVGVRPEVRRPVRGRRRRRDRQQRDRQ